MQRQIPVILAAEDSTMYSKWSLGLVTMKNPRDWEPVPYAAQGDIYQNEPKHQDFFIQLRVWY